jgi:DNA mismatch endonuclease Vsr
MPDFLTKKQRSERMALIKSKNTKPELKMASILRKAKIRFRRHRKKIMGNPDFHIVGTKVLLFVDGKFWHGKNFENWGHKLKPFWREKIIRNMARDKDVKKTLQGDGWKVVRVWEDEVCNAEKCLTKLESAIRSLGE